MGCPSPGIPSLAIQPALLGLPHVTDLHCAAPLWAFAGGGLQCSAGEAALGIYQVGGVWSALAEALDGLDLHHLTTTVQLRLDSVLRRAGHFVACDRRAPL